MHPQNRFWKCLEEVFSEKTGSSINDKKIFLKKHNIALWDVIESCQINESSDSSIKNVKVNNLNKIIKNSKIEYIYNREKSI